MQKRGFTLIELLVVIAIIGVLAAILIPNILSAIRDAKKTTDATNLKRLVEQYTAGQAKDRKKPRSRGWRFWVAMFTGDGPGGQSNFIVNDEDQAYVGSGECGLLISPVDDVPDRSAVKTGIENAIGSNGAQAADNTWVSYAGPQDFRKFDKSGNIVGCTGTRDNIAFFPDGFNVVFGNGSVEFYKFADMRDKHQWNDGEQRFDSSGPLQHVFNLDHAGN